MSCGFGIGAPAPSPAWSAGSQIRTSLAAMLLLAELVLTSTGCKKTGLPLDKSAADAQTVDPQHLTTLRLRWRLPGMEAIQSLLTSNPTGNIFLALKQTGDHTWDLCGIEVQRGFVKWCSRLSRRADIAPSVAADKAMVYDPAGNLTAYDLETGQFQWSMKLGCEIGPKNLHAVGKGLALARCGRGGIVANALSKTDLVAIDLDRGQVRWRHDLPTYNARIFIHAEKLFADLDLGFSHPRNPPILPRRFARGFRLFPPPSRWPDMNSLVGSQESGWTILDVGTGESLPTSELGRAPDESDRRTAPYLIAESLFSDGVVVFDQDKDGAKANPFLRERSSECQPALHDPWSWMYPRGPILRAGRLFAIGCDEISEIDPATGERLQTWPMASGEDFFASDLIALEVAGQRLTLVVGSHDDRETGRIVVFEGTRLIFASKAPGLDPDLVALMENVLVVQEQVHLSTPGNVTSGATRPKPVLAGYAVSEVSIAGDDADRSNASRIRTLIAHLGTADRNYCSECEAILDAKSVADLKSIPRWEDILASLLLDRSSLTRETAFAAAKQIHTPGLIRELLRLLAPAPQPAWRPWNRESGWWNAIGERQNSASLQAAMVLIELRHVPAMKPLVRLMLNAPTGDHHTPLGSYRFPAALCPWIEDSDLPEAKAAIEEYDRTLNAPGAWKARCADATPTPPPRRRSSVGR